MLDNGQIIETGTYEQLMNENGSFCMFMRSYLELNQANRSYGRAENSEKPAIIGSKTEKDIKRQTSKPAEEIKDSSVKKKTKAGEKIIEKEKIQSGRVSNLV